MTDLNMLLSCFREKMSGCHSTLISTFGPTVLSGSIRLSVHRINRSIVKINERIPNIPGPMIEAPLKRAMEGSTSKEEETRPTFSKFLS